MTLGNALKFVNKVKKETDFRKKLYRYDTIKELNDFLADKSFIFTPEEFEDAIQKNRVEAQFEEIANEYSEIEHWWKMIMSQIN